MFDDDDSEISTVVIIFLGIAAVAAIFTTLFTVALPGPAAFFQPPGAQRSASGPNLGMAFAGGKLTLSGVVPDEATKQSLLLQSQVMFGIGNVVDELKIQAGAPVAKWKGRLLDLFAQLRGLASFKLGLSGNQVTLEGLAGSDAAKNAFEKWFGAFLGEGMSVQSAIKIDQAGAAARAFDGSVLLNEAIEFATGSAEIPQAAQQRLALIAAVLKEDGRKLTIAGHTDNVGDPAANKTLSEARATAVQKFLVDKGVAPGNLATTGFGEERPIADNATAEGRQHNRRIEFVQ